MMPEALADAMEELSSAEDFLEFFGVDYDPKVVQVNRLHIMQRLHDYLKKGGDAMPEGCSEEVARSICRQLLARAYQDFVESNAITEKVFKVFRMQEPQTTFVSLDQLLGP